MFSRIKESPDRGFTLLELLVVVAIIGLLVMVVVLFLNTSRAKAQDSKTKEVLSNVRSAAQEERNDKGAFTDVCVNGKAYGVISTLAEQYGLAYEQYKCYAGAEDFAVIFPLKAESGYWCVDSNSVAKKVGSTTITGGTYNCDAVVVASNGGSAPVVTVLGENPYGGYVSPTQPFDESQYGGVSAYDAEDGALPQSSISYVDQVINTNPQNQCGSFVGQRIYTATDSNGNTGTATRTFSNVDQPSCGANNGGGGGTLIGPDTGSSFVCDYAAPPQGCSYVPGPSYDPASSCGMVLSCPSGGPALQSNNNPGGFPSGPSDPSPWMQNP